MGNVRFGHVTPPHPPLSACPSLFPSSPFCHLHVNLTVPITEVEILVNKRMPHFNEQQSERKPPRKHTDLHPLVCIDSAPLKEVNVEGLIYGPEGGGVLLQERERERGGKIILSIFFFYLPENKFAFSAFGVI